MCGLRYAGEHLSTTFSWACSNNNFARIDVGGKLLTNQLKELVSYRQWNMMDETYVMNEVKHACCFASLNFKSDMETSQYVQSPTRSEFTDTLVSITTRENTIVQEYVLPDFSANRQGHVRQPDEVLQESSQILYMNNERFTVPELLFRPDDIGETTFRAGDRRAHLCTCKALISPASLQPLPAVSLPCPKSYEGCSGPILALSVAAQSFPRLLKDCKLLCHPRSDVVAESLQLRGVAHIGTDRLRGQNLRVD